MYSNFQNKITKKMYARAKELGMTFDEVVTLASIIQKEGTNEENMANISSVFHNRLENMYEYPHLQSDTTDNYIEDVIRPNIPSSSLALYENVITAYDTTPAWVFLQDLYAVRVLRLSTPRFIRLKQITIIS